VNPDGTNMFVKTVPTVKATASCTHARWTRMARTKASCDRPDAAVAHHEAVRWFLSMQQTIQSKHARQFKRSPHRAGQRQVTKKALSECGGVFAIWPGDHALSPWDGYNRVLLPTRLPGDKEWRHGLVRQPPLLLNWAA